MSTLLEMRKNRLKNTNSLKAGGNVGNVGNVYNPSLRASSSKNNNDIHKKRGPEKVSKVTKVSTTSSSFDTDWAVAALSGNLREPPEQKTVFCRDCRHFTPNPHSPDCGLGSCDRRESGHPDRGQWPGAESYCKMFDAEVR